MNNDMIFQVVTFFIVLFIFVLYFNSRLKRKIFLQLVSDGHIANDLSLIYGMNAKVRKLFYENTGPLSKQLQVEYRISINDKTFIMSTGWHGFPRYLAND